MQKHTSLTKLGAAKEFRIFSKNNSEYFDGDKIRDDAPDEIKNEYNEFQSIFNKNLNGEVEQMPSKMNIATRDTPLSGIEYDPLVMELAGRKVKINGVEGIVKIDEENNVLFDGGDKEILLGKTTDDSFIKSTASEHSIEVVQDKGSIKPKVELSGNDVKIDGDKYTIVSFNKDGNDNLVSISLLDKNGKKITKRDSDLALDIAIEKSNQELNYKFRIFHCLVNEVYY